MKLNWGIIGLGNIAHQFVRDLQLIPDGVVKAVASRTLEKSKAFAETYGIDHFYGSYNELIEDPSIDIVYIATPHDSHTQWSVAALEKGKHVLCEKPLAVNKAQVTAIIEAARKHNRFMMEAFWSRFNPSIEHCLKYIEQGEIGQVNYINADFTFYREDSPQSRMLNMDLAGGSLLDMGVYPVFLAYLILGMPQEIKAIGNFHQTGADLQTAAIFKYPNAVANIMSGFNSQSDMVAKIYGTHGRIYISPIWHEAQGLTLQTGNFKDIAVQKIDLPTKGKGFTYEIEECHRCIKAGHLESDKWSWQNSIDLISITDTIRAQIGLKYPFE